MYKPKKKSEYKPLISLSNISIQYRLPLLISALLLVVIVTFTWTSYLSIKNSALEVGRERLSGLSKQFISFFQTSTQSILSETHKKANDTGIKNFLISNQKKEDALLAMQKIGAPTDSSSLLIELNDINKNHVLSSPKDGYSIPIKLDSEFDYSSVAPLYSYVGHFYLINDSIFYPVVTAVIEEEKPMGYLIRWRLLRSSPKALKQFSQLLGANTSLYFGNNDGTLWTDMIKAVPKPPIEIKNFSEILEYSKPDGNIVLASVSPIPGSPWLFLIELSKNAVLDPVNRFLEIIAVIGAILLFVGIFLAWAMSHNITSPLNKLTLATSNIAAGNYSSLVEVNRKDELGKLANAFNTMVVEVKNSQHDLERKVLSRTAQLKTANAELAELNKKLKELDELKTNFFTNVSHELRTPLALIMGPVEKLLSQRELANYYERDLRVIQQNARILLKQVNNLLDLSKLEVGKMEMNYAEIDLAHLIRVTSSYFESLAAEKDIYFNINVPDSLYIQADPEKIERILINLLSNAFKFTPDEGTISCLLTKENSNAVLKIVDSGPGIQSEIKDTLFKRFHLGGKGLTRHLGSTGLGLSIVKEFIELHNGSIEVENSREGGAIFSFNIPLTAPQGTIIQGKAIVKEDEIKSNIDSYHIVNTESYDEKNENINVLVKQSKKSNGKELPSVLIIEDNSEMNRFISESLGYKYNVISAFDGEEGYKKAAETKPDLIITDIMMPKLTGDMVVQKIRENSELESIPVIILSAKADEELKIELLKEGVQDYISKPFTIEELRARVNNMIKMKLAKDRLQNELNSHSNDISSLVDEIADRKNLIESSLKEKELLLQEIHHRVKNNLQVISSLLNLQSNSVKDPESFEVFRESQNRIKSMALIHEKLYQSKNLLKINLEEYVNDLINNLYKSYNLDSDYLSLKVGIKNIFFNIDTAISLGLIINELISNSLKHAFKDRIPSDGEVQILMDNLNSNNYCLTVKDNGKGLPDDFDLKESQTLGLRLVNTLVQQIEGNIQVINNEGTEFKITFQTPDIRL